MAKQKKSYAQLHKKSQNLLFWKRNKIEELKNQSLLPVHWIIGLALALF